jgi:D-lactate dehydrogenase (cytochrome)
LETISVSSSVVIEALKNLLGDRVSTSQSVREHHSHGESWHAPGLPDAVVFPASTDEVAAIVKLCAAHRTPVIAFGMGSSLEGHVNAASGGVSIDLTRMTRVLRLSPEDLDVTVEAGLTRLKLDAHLKNTGLMFPIDPGADATIGGMAATRASGTTAVRYGTMRENVLGLTVVLPDGRVIKTGGRARKSSSGYDLTRLFVGSEGTLGVITELTLRLYGRPEAVRAAVCPFESMAGAAKTVIQTIQLGIPVARIEIIDEAQLRVVNAYSKTSYPLAPTLFFEFHGISELAVEDQIRAVEEIAREHGAREFKWAATLEELLRDGGVAARRARLDHRHLRADFAPGGVHPRDPGRSRLGQRRGSARWPRRRRQFPLDHHARRRRPAGVRSDLATQRAPRRARAQIRRYLQRRARRRPRQVEVPAGRARRGARRDARDQARD